MESFENKFWRRFNHPQTKVDSAARDAMDKVGRVFSSKKQRLVVRLLDVISDPLTEKRLKWAGEQINAQLLLSLFQPGPSRKEVRNLTRRLETIGRDLDRFGAKGMSSKRDFFVKLAEDCCLGAKHLKYFDLARTMNPRPKAPRTLTYKAFWKHVPIAKLCRELEAPWAVSFAEVEILLRCAYSARNRPWSRPARSIEREYKHLRRMKFDDLVKSAAWLRVLDRLLLLTSATK